MCSTPAATGEDVQIEAELVVEARLEPGEVRPLERVCVALGLDANVLLEAFGDAHGRVAGARTARPFLAGWCSWYHFFHDVNEADVLRNLEALAAARPGLCVDVVQIDDGYQRAIGDWLETNAKFPRGLAPLAAEIRAAGFTAGIWTAPFCVVPESGLFAKHGDWLLRSGEAPLRGLLHPVWSRDASVYVLDPSRPEVREHLEATFRELRALGFDYLKLDFLYTAAMQADAYDARLGRAQRLRAGLEAVRAGAGEGAFLLGCGCPLGAAVGVVDGMRIGPDVSPSWRAEEAIRIPGIEETLPSTRSAVRSVLARAWMHRRLWLNDPDCLMARRNDTRLSPDEARTLAIAIAATGGMLLFSDDWTTLDAAARELVRDTLAAARAVDALGLPGCARAQHALAGEFASAVVAADAEGGTLALLNPGDEAAIGELDLRALGLAPLAAPPEPLLGSPAPRSDVAGSLSVALAPHASALFRVRRAFPLAVFCDFDGTFSVQDVGATLAKIHAGDRRPVMWARYERGEITAWEYNLEILDRLPLPEARARGVSEDDRARSRCGCADRVVPRARAAVPRALRRLRLQSEPTPGAARRSLRLRGEPSALRRRPLAHRGGPSEPGLRLRNGDLQAWTHRGLPRRSSRSHARAHRQRPRLRSVWCARCRCRLREGFARRRARRTRHSVSAIRDALGRDPAPRAPARPGSHLAWSGDTARSW